MLIRDMERPLLPRARSVRDGHPLRKTAEGLGVFLNRLSETVRSRERERGANADTDTVDSVMEAHRRNGHARGFKFHAPFMPNDHEAAAAAAAADGPAVDYDLTEDEAEALAMLREARDIAADATNVVVPAQDRETAQERLRALFFEMGAKRVNILSDMLNERASAPGSSGLDQLFSVETPDSARAAHNGIDEMIMRFLNAGRGDGADGAERPYMDHGAAISASEQLRDFLLSEGPASAFARFREVNRSSVLGLLA